jgi:hypothetical protein
LSIPAPAPSAANASVAVANPGITSIPSDTARSITAGTVLGVTIRRAPAPCTASTSAGLSTVPAPQRQRSPNFPARRATLWSGEGELSGTSIAPIPAS